MVWLSAYPFPHAAWGLGGTGWFLGTNDSGMVFVGPNAYGAAVGVGKRPDRAILVFNQPGGVSHAVRVSLLL